MAGARPRQAGRGAPSMVRHVAAFCGCWSRSGTGRAQLAANLCGMVTASFFSPQFLHALLPGHWRDATFLHEREPAVVGKIEIPADYFEGVA